MKPSERDTMADDTNSAQHDGPATSDTPEPVTCLSTEDHNDNVRDMVSHYFGCIQICERDGFFNRENKFWKDKESKKEESSAGSPADRRAEAKRHVDELWGKSKKTVKDHANRTRRLIREIKGGKDANLVEYVGESHKAWCEYATLQQKALKVDWTEWRRRREGREEGESMADPRSETYVETAPAPMNGNDDYSLEKDVHAYIIQYEPGIPKITGDAGFLTDHAVDDDHAGSRLSHGGSLLPLVGKTDGRLKGKFPDQRLPISRLLLEDTKNSPSISHKENRDLIRYFHFPSNNMRVSLRPRLLSN